MKINWFIAIHGKVEKAHLGMAVFWVDDEPASKSRDELVAQHQKIERGEIVWMASSPHVDGVYGFGDCPEYAITDFEYKMRLAG